METMLTVLFGLIGAAVGSFLNVCIDRLPAGRSLAYPSSHCDACQRRLTPLDLIPVASYLWLRRRCRYCQAPIPQRVFWVELGTGLLFAFIYRQLGPGTELAVTMFYSALFIVLGVIDLKHKLLLNKIIYPAAGIALIINALLPQPPGIVSGLIGGGIGFTILLIPALISPRGMGFGDVKMAALIGLVTGFPLVFVALMLGIIGGGLAAILLLLFKIKGRKEAIPFGPFLSLATLVTLLWGNQILGWYLGLF